MSTAVLTGPDNTAVRTALWRALHVEVDDEPTVLDDLVGAELVGDPGWRRRGDMNAQHTRGGRGSIVARARFVEDLVIANVDSIDQYVVMGAGLDSFSQRRPDIASRMTVFEIDQPETQNWKQDRLTTCGYAVSESLRFVPADFEDPESWWKGMQATGFRAGERAVVSSLGVSMYLTDDANRTLLRQLTRLAPGSLVVLTIQVPPELVAVPDRTGRRAAEQGARRSGTPFVSFYTPSDLISMAADAGFASAEHVSTPVLTQRYFADRQDGLAPSTAEQVVLLTR